MIRSLVLTFFVLTLFSCGKNDDPQEVFFDTTFPVIQMQTPVANQLYNKDFPVHITGAVTDNYISTIDIYVVDSLKNDTIYSFSPNVTGKTGHAYNHQYYNPLDSGIKRIYVVAIDSANHKSADTLRYLVY